MPRGWTKLQAMQAWTRLSFCKDFRHLLPIPRYWQWAILRRDPVVKCVRTNDRIKYWNIVPGDQVRLLNDREGTVYQVHMINRLSNRVMLKTEMDKSSEVNSPRSKTAPYHMCQLFVGKYEFPPVGDTTSPRLEPVFALRVGMSNVHWGGNRWSWDRYATATVPRLPHLAQGESDHVSIPWPKVPRPRYAEPTLYDTREDVVMQVTYRPPVFPVYAHHSVSPPQGPSEQEYIKAVRRSGDDNYDPSQPVEVFLSKELSNPHSRAKKQARWQAYQLYKRSLLKKFVDEEMKNLDSRKRSDAQAEATFKWRQHLAEERKAEMKRRWKNRGDEARLARKSQKKMKKEERRKRQLRDLVLSPAPNQVLPGSAVAEGRV